MYGGSPVDKFGSKTSTRPLTGGTALHGRRRTVEGEVCQQYMSESFPDIILRHFLTVTPIVVPAVASLLRPL